MFSVNYEFPVPSFSVSFRFPIGLNVVPSEQVVSFICPVQFISTYIFVLRCPARGGPHGFDYWYGVVEGVVGPASYPSHAMRSAVFLNKNFGDVVIGGAIRSLLVCLISILKEQKIQYNNAKLPFSNFPDFLLFVLHIYKVATNGLMMSSATFIHSLLPFTFCLKYKTTDVCAS